MTERTSRQNIRIFTKNTPTRPSNEAVLNQHKRHTRKGVYRLEDPRDIYEMVANQGARRLRSCILGIIPGDVIEAAVKQCEMTMRIKSEVTPERITGIIEKFKEFGVTKNQIQERLQRKIESVTPAQVVALGKIYNSLKDGMSAVAVKLIKERVFSGMPTTAEIINAMRTSTPQLPDIAKLRVFEIIGQIRAVGSYGNPKWEDPIVGDLLKRRWSWQSLCAMTEEEHKWWVKEFIEAYRVMAEHRIACPQIETNIKIKGLIKDIGGVDETKKRLRRAV